MRIKKIESKCTGSCHLQFVLKLMSSTSILSDSLAVSFLEWHTSLGAVHCRSVRICSCLLLHILTLGVLDQHVHYRIYLLLSYGTRSEWHISGLQLHLETVCNSYRIQQILRGVDDPTGMRKEVASQESALTLQAIWDFEVRVRLVHFCVCLSCRCNLQTICSHFCSLFSLSLRPCTHIIRYSQQGYLKFSPIFYGYYSNEETTSIGM